jgi:lipopolysaccharide transport protein LptA
VRSIPPIAAQSEPAPKTLGSLPKPPPYVAPTPSKLSSSRTDALAATIERSSKKHGPALVAMLGDTSPADLELPDLDLNSFSPVASLTKTNLPGDSSTLSQWQRETPEPSPAPAPNKVDEADMKPIAPDETAPPAMDSLAKIEGPVSSEPPARLRDRDQQYAAQKGSSDTMGLGNVNITAEDEVDFDLEAGTLVFQGNAAMEGERFKLKSDRIEVGMQKDQEGMRTAVGVGNVTIEMTVVGVPEGYIGYCERATYNPEDGSIVLTGWPEIIGNGGRQVAATPETKVILYRDGRLKTYGRNKTYLSDL